MPSNYEKVLILQVLDLTLQRIIMVQFLKDIFDDETNFENEYDYMMYGKLLKDLHEQAEKERKEQVPRFREMLNIQDGNKFMKLTRKNMDIVVKKMEIDNSLCSCMEYYNDCLEKIKDKLKKSMTLAVTRTH